MDRLDLLVRYRVVWFLDLLDLRWVGEPGIEHLAVLKTLTFRVMAKSTEQKTSLKSETGLWLRD